MVSWGARTSYECQLNAPQDGIEVEVGDIKLLFKFLLVNLGLFDGVHDSGRNGQVGSWGSK